MLRQVMVLAGALVVATNAGLAFAANPDTGPGCGLGKLAWADFKNQKNIAPQVLMVTTNATGLNTFGISSGTSGCTNDGQVWAEHKVGVFASMNFENLSQEMAQGHGEHLDITRHADGCASGTSRSILVHDTRALHNAHTRRRSITGRVC